MLGVDPERRGPRLGALLAGRPARTWRERGLDTVMLYVEGDNARALRLYERSGFYLPPDRRGLPPVRTGRTASTHATAGADVDAHASLALVPSPFT